MSAGSYFFRHNQWIMTDVLIKLQLLPTDNVSLALASSPAQHAWFRQHSHTHHSGGQRAGGTQDHCVHEPDAHVVPQSLAHCPCRWEVRGKVWEYKENSWDNLDIKSWFYCLWIQVTLKNSENNLSINAALSLSAQKELHLWNQVN